MTEFPLYMMVGDVLVPIGMAQATPSLYEGHVQILADFDVFPGSRLSFCRIVNWEEFLTYARTLYPEGFIMTENDPKDNGNEGIRPEEKERIREKVLEKFDEMQKNKDGDKK